MNDCMAESPCSTALANPTVTMCQAAFAGPSCKARCEVDPSADLQQVKHLLLHIQCPSHPIYVVAHINVRVVAHINIRCSHCGHIGCLQCSPHTHAQCSPPELQLITAVSAAPASHRPSLLLLQLAAWLGLLDKGLLDEHAS
eukprot:jgi/Ulvmu1/2516/UM138_0020.1